MLNMAGALLARGNPCGPNMCQVDGIPEGTPAANPRALVSRDASDLGDCLQPRAEMDHLVNR
jgi:hypothetical protein